MTEPKARPGDTLRKIMGVVLVVDEVTPTTAAAAAYAAAGNSPATTYAAREYARARVRALSTGDVVVVTLLDDSTHALVCEPFGWSRADLADFKVQED